MFLPVETNTKTRNKDEKKLALLGSGLYINGHTSIFVIYHEGHEAHEE